MNNLHRHGIIASSIKFDTFDPTPFIIGESGIWEATASTLFTDPALTTPVTTNGDVVGGISETFSATPPRTFLGTTVDLTERPTWNSTDNSLVFDGTNDFLAIDLDPNNALMTFGVRFKPNNNTGIQTLIGTRRSATGITSIDINAGVLTAIEGSAAVTDPSSTDLTASGGYHTVFFKYSNNAGDLNTLYLNGSLIATVPKAGLGGILRDIAIGARGLSSTGVTADQYFNGEISHFLITTFYMTDAQVLETHNSWSS